MRLSVAIIARDEERHITGCMESVSGLADELVVLVDARSCDRTAAVCEAYGARVSIEPWRGFPAQRNHALELCNGEWVLFIDADERVTPELYAEINTLLDDGSFDGAQGMWWTGGNTVRRPPSTVQYGSSSGYAGYWIPRYNLFFGRRVRGGGWYPDHQLRLLRRSHAHFDEQRHVHEFAQIDGETGFLKGHFLHYNIERLGEFWRKQTLYALAEARTLQAEGRRVRLRNFLGAPAREFWRRYIRLGGWRDGPLGLFLCGALAWFEVVKFGLLVGLMRDRHITMR